MRQAAKPSSSGFYHVRFFTYLSAATQDKQKIINDISKISIKSEKITPFGGILYVMEHFSRFVGPVIDKVLGLRCTSFGYQYSQIGGSLSSIYFCGDDCVEDVTSHLMPHLSLHPTLRTCSSDTILRGISELSQHDPYF